MRYVGKVVVILSLFVGVAYVSSTLAAVSMLYTTPAGVEPAKITDWMQGWGSIVGVVGALLAAIFTALLLRHEMREASHARAQASEERLAAAKDRAEIAAQREEERKVLARSIISDVPRINAVQEDVGPGKVLLSGLSVLIWNVGESPMRDVVVEIWAEHGSRLLAQEKFGTFLPESSLKPQGAMFGGGSSTSVPTRRVDARFKVLIVVSDEILGRDGLRVEMRFTDANGRRWRRINNGPPEGIKFDENDRELLCPAVHWNDPKDYANRQRERG
ncbi:hypothetical protein O7632_31175 [Solwaraspora sp. WMMD406]|uniref:hypothetical protein n=1 Tax=Solwaraspora sp. WMMD406 TaxID=3016095 RepID=UPI0024169E28|nr:hypothetical protein [Solwaraspora sp. WMMD406]MDG4768523.1 hypothetical protein [Solwaraspora sp. WMMD406]